MEKTTNKPSKAIFMDYKMHFGDVILVVTVSMN